MKETKKEKCEKHFNNIITKYDNTINSNFKEKEHTPRAYTFHLFVIKYSK